MRTFACYSIYNEAEHLSESVQSLIDSVDCLIFVDGACYDLWIGKHCWTSQKPESMSTDGTLEILQALKQAHPGKISVIPAISPWPHEVVKRSAYFREADLRGAREGDLLLIVDGDEIIHGDLTGGLKEVAEHQTAGRVLIRNFRDGREDWRGEQIRIWPWHPGLHYCQNHVTILDENDHQVNHGSIRTEKFEIHNLH